MILNDYGGWWAGDFYRTGFAIVLLIQSLDRYGTSIALTKGSLSPSLSAQLIVRLISFDSTLQANSYRGSRAAWRQG